MIDIIIPAYNAHKTIEKTLISICLQTCKEYLNVIIVDDASDKDYSEIINKFSKKIKISQISNKKNSGPAVSRQLGIDNSYNDYIMFIDADDLFYDCFSIANIKKIVDNVQCDVVCGGAVFEENDRLVNHYEHFGCLHGKAFKRKFLVENNIEFNNYRIHEDNAFCQLLLMAHPKIVYSKDMIYVYKNNKESVTRSKQLVYERAFEFIDNMKWVLNKAEERKYDSKSISEFLGVTLGYLYSIYCAYKDKENINDFIKAIIPLYKKDVEYYDIRAEVFRLRVESFYANNNYSISFHQFLQIIESKIEDK